ncbi:phosphatase PAP2 family protein [Arthrobacter sp. Sr24]
MPLSTAQSTALRPLAWSRSRLFWVSLPALAVVLAGVWIMMATGNHPPFHKFDDGWYQLMRSSRTPWLTDANRVLDFAGNTGMVIYSVLLLLVLLRRHWRLALFTAAVNLGALGLTHLIKFLVDRPRPADRLVPVDHGSYPSGHVSGTVTAMVVTAVVLGKLWMWISGTILSIAMMYSRTYLGVHWFSDTIAGVLVGVGLTLLLWALLRDKCLDRNIRTDRVPANSQTA